MPDNSYRHLCLAEAQARLVDSYARRGALLDLVRSLEEKGLDSSGVHRTLMAVNERIELQKYHVETLLRSNRLSPSN